MMVELGIHYEEDEGGALTGKVQVVDEDLQLVLDTFDTEEEADTEMAKLQAQFARDEKIQAEYLEWETACLTRHEIGQGELREYLVNVVIV